ncbi:acetyltransferase [Ectobacillus polymachus]|uniref:acetyltransferase n=1 Tax=Ectobacillus polymachus TaxID=1508806 RepID=UPI003A8BD745
MIKQIVILGANGFGREVAQLIKDINESNYEWELIGYFDDYPSSHGEIRNGFPVIGPISLLENDNYNDIYVVCAFGNPNMKKTTIEKAIQLNNTIKFATLIHPTAVIGDGTYIGAGSIICAGNVITTNIKINNHVIINISSTIGHDSIIEDYATILPGANISGNVILHEGVDIGTGAAIIPKVEIGGYTVVGAGTVVTKSLPEHCTAVGVPAKVIKVHKP